MTYSSSVLGFRAGFYRAKIFKVKEFTEKPAVKKLAEEHDKYFKAKMNNVGYPDMGNGRYSEHLSYEQWVQFNNRQRGHYNMIESSGPLLACLITSGLEYPRVAGALGSVYAFGRILYGLGYSGKKGADGRLAGAGLSGITALALNVLAFVVAAQKIMGK